MTNIDRDKCSLFPYEVTETMGAQDAKERAGWNITAFNLPEVWKSVKGEGVKIHVLDTGCDLDHPDLVDNLIPGMNFIRPGKPPIDDNSHGTHCAGIICAGENGAGMIGVAPKATVAPVKVLDAKGNGSMTIVAQGIRWSADNGADIISLSLGCPNKSSPVQKAIQYATKKGIPVFCAAGNAGLTENVFYPARYPETIAIGSIDEDFGRSNFSNTGDNLDFMAPGGDILSTIPDNWYAVFSGTSMACPFAVGVAALMLSYSRKNKGLELKTVEDYRSAFRCHATSVSNPDFGGKKFFEGWGIIDPRKFNEWLEARK